MPNRSRHASHPKAKLGQNFLVSPTAPRAIVDALGDLTSAVVVEIGPGRGAITALLARRVQRLVAVELDPALALELERMLAASDAAPVEVLTQDILALDFTRLASGLESRLVIVGNLPYYITSDILMHLFAHHAVIDRGVLMVQREVADRLAASPGSRDYGLLSATTQMYARVEPLLTLPPDAFSPPPGVHSTVLRFTMQPRFTELGVSQNAFLRFLRQVFAQKRKTITNNLRAAGRSSSEIQAALAGCAIDPGIRAEALPLEAMAKLFQWLELPSDLSS